MFSLLLVGTISAQEKKEEDSNNNRDKHIISFRFGYSIPVSQSQIGSPRKEIGKTFLETKSNGTTIVSEKNAYGSRGAGLNFSLAYEYMITENISIGMDFSYLYTLGINDAFRLQQSGSNISYFANQDSYTSMFRATPMVGIYANENLLIRPYAKFGLIIPFAGSTLASLTIIDDTGVAFDDLMPIIDKALFDQIQATGTGIPVPTTTNIEASTSGAFSLGFDARLGAQYKIVDHLNIFVELNMQMLTVKAHQTTINKFESVTTDAFADLGAVLGIDVKDYTLDDIPEFLRVTTYVNEINEESNVYGTAYYNREKPADQLGFRDNYNAFGFIVGVKYGF
jgi:hypothetical protein